MYRKNFHLFYIVTIFQLEFTGYVYEIKNVYDNKIYLYNTTYNTLPLFTFTSINYKNTHYPT